MKALLINREWNVPGTWYEPCRKLEQFKSVINADYVFTSSSAGDWEGIFFQKLNGRIYAIPFNQENNYPRSGFTLYTGNVVAKIKGESCDFEAVTNELIEHLYN
jgi:hypothetical protein